MTAINPAQIQQKHPSERIRGADDSQKGRKPGLTFGRVISSCVGFWEDGLPTLSGITASHSYPLRVIF